MHHWFPRAFQTRHKSLPQQGDFWFYRKLTGGMPPYGPPELSQSGMMTQQQLRTSPLIARKTIATTLFLEFHKSEIRFWISTLSVGCGVWFNFIRFSLSLSRVEMTWSLPGRDGSNNKESPPRWIGVSSRLDLNFACLASCELRISPGRV